MKCNHVRKACASDAELSYVSSDMRNAKESNCVSVSVVPVELQQSLQDAPLSSPRLEKGSLVVTAEAAAKRLTNHGA